MPLQATDVLPRDAEVFYFLTLVLDFQVLRLQIELKVSLCFQLNGE